MAREVLQQVQHGPEFPTGKKGYTAGIQLNAFTPVPLSELTLGQALSTMPSTSRHLAIPIVQFGTSPPTERRNPTQPTGASRERLARTTTSMQQTETPRSGLKNKLIKTAKKAAAVTGAALAIAAATPIAAASAETTGPQTVAAAGAYLNADIYMEASVGKYGHTLPNQGQYWEQFTNRGKTRVTHDFKDKIDFINFWDSQWYTYVQPVSVAPGQTIKVHWRNYKPISPFSGRRDKIDKVVYLV